MNKEAFAKHITIFCPTDSESTNNIKYCTVSFTIETNIPVSGPISDVEINKLKATGTEILYMELYNE